MKKWIKWAALGAAALLIIGTVFLFIKDIPKKKVVSYLQGTYPEYDFSLQADASSASEKIWQATEKDTAIAFHVAEGEDGQFTDDLYSASLVKAFVSYQNDMVPITCWDMTIIADSVALENVALQADVTEETAENTFIELNSLLHYMHSKHFPININVTVKAAGEEDLNMTLTDVMPVEQVDAFIKEYGGEAEEISAQ